jgi:transcriptional regulator with XRE-family HTH domain
MITNDQLRAARKLLGWSQADLAARIGVNGAAISDFEISGRVHPTLNLPALFQVLQVAGVEFTDQQLHLKPGSTGGTLEAILEPQTD